MVVTTALEKIHDGGLTRDVRSNRLGYLVGFPASYFCIKAISETDLTEDLMKFDVSTLILRGEDD
jgi:hypothetical protein